MRRLLSNIEVLQADDPAGEYSVAVNLVLYKLAVQGYRRAAHLGRARDVQAAAGGRYVAAG